MRVRGICALLVLTSLAYPESKGNSGDSSPLYVTQDLPGGIYPLAGIDPDEGGDNGDLHPIGRIVGTAKAVGLGESFHTSGGYHQAKARLVHYLVEELGFRVLALETPRLQAQPAVDYFAACAAGTDRSRDKALKAIFPVFASTTMSNLFDWLCQYNNAHRYDPVRFVAFDMQEPAEQLQAIRSYLMQQVPDDAPALTVPLAGCAGTNGQPATQPIPDSARDGCLSATSNALQYMDDHKATLIRNSSAGEFSLAELALQGMSAHEDQVYYFYRDTGLSWAARDREMAHTLEVQRDLSFPDAKAMIWAANYHVEKVGSQDDAFHIKIKNMGQHLAEAWGHDYVSLGLLSYQTDINWPLTQDNWCRYVPVPIAENSVERLLHELNEPYLIVDLAAMSAQSRPFFFPGQVYRYGGDDVGGDSMSTSVISSQFDALIYLAHSRSMTSIYWGDCHPKSSR